MHPDGLHCPQGHALPIGQCPHSRDRAPIVENRCRECGCVWNIFSTTTLKGIRYDCRKILLMLRGFSQGVSTNHLSNELHIDYSCLLEWRHRLQEFAFENRSLTPLPDTRQESDEMFQNAGEKGTAHRNVNDPPRRRANKKKGLGTYPSDRPPIQGTVGRDTGQVRLNVCANTQAATLDQCIDQSSPVGTMIYTDGSTIFRA